MTFSLHGRTAIVTGAGSPTGIGFATAVMLRDLGADVVVTATTDRIHDRARDVGGLGIVADLTDERQVGLLPEQVDILVNNAGMVAIGQDFESARLTDMPLPTWRAGLARNLDTAFLVSRHVVPAMRERRRGRIVNVASVTGPVMAMRDDPAYAAAKAGMVGLTRSMAVDLAADGITVNAVAPGWIATGSQTPDERRQGLVTPIRRSGTPQEVAAAVVWFCLAESSYVTGQCLVVDGGNSIAEERAFDGGQ